MNITNAKSLYTKSLGRKILLVFLVFTTQLWDGGYSQLVYTSGDDFYVLALDCTLKFTRSGDDKIAQLILNSDKVFAKVSN